MARVLVRLGIVLSVFSVQAEEHNLYLIAGTATPKRNDSYASTLLRVKDDGSVELVETLMNADAGIEWVGVSHDRRMAVLLPKLIPRRPESEIVVVDFDKGAAVKRCRIPDVPGTSSQITQWLSDLPRRGLFFEQHMFANDATRGRVQRMALDPWLPCDQSFDFAEPSEVKYIVASGTAGIAGMGSHDGLLGSVDENRRIRIPVVREHHALDYEIPLAMRRSRQPDAAPVRINNSQVFVVCVPDHASLNSCASFVFRKRDKTWRALPVMSKVTEVRAFGDYIGVVELHPRTDQSQQNAGRAEWRKERTAIGPAQEEWFEVEYRDLVYPGRLHLYASDTERTYTIITNQADSEILLAEDDTVYYRICDRLYAAPITGKELGKARLLAKAEEIRDAHWAFIKHD